MATEFEQLRLSITLIDDTSAGIKAVRAEMRGTTGSASDYQKLLRDNTKSARVYGDVVGYVDGRLVLLGGSVGYLRSKLDGIGSSLASTGPTLTAFAKQQQEANQASQLIGMSIGQLKSLRSQAESAGVSKEDADKTAAAAMDLLHQLSHVGGRTQFQKMLMSSGFRFDYPEYTMRLAKAKDYAELFNIANQERRDIENALVEKGGMDPELAKEAGIKWMILHGFPAASVAMDALRLPTKEYLVEQQRQADVAEAWLKQAVKLDQNVKNIGRKFVVAISPGGPLASFYDGMQQVVKVSEWLANNAEAWFWLQILSFAGTPAGLALFGPWMLKEGFQKLYDSLFPPKKQKLSIEIEELGDRIQNINLITGPTGPKIVPAAFEGGGIGYSGTQGLPGWLQTPGGGGRLPATPGTGSGSTPGTGTGGTPGTPSAPAPQAPSGGTPGAAPRPAPTPGTSTGGTPGTPNAATPSPGTPQAGEQPIIDYAAQANLRTGGDMDKVEGMVIHHTSGVYGGRGPAGVSDVLRNRGFSSTFFIDREGKIYRLTPEGKMAFHTKPGGTGTLGSAGAQFSNKNMEGVEIEARNDADVLPIQRAAAANLIGQRSRLHGYDPKTNVVGHGELNRDKERDEGMSTVSRIRSGELSTATGAPMPTAEPRAPEEVTPVRPHPLLGARQGGQPIGVEQPAISEFGLPAVSKEYIPKTLPPGWSAGRPPSEILQPPSAQQIIKAPPAVGVPDEEGIVLPPTPPPLPPLPPRPDRPGWTDRSGRRHYYPPGWLARKEYDGTRDLTSEEVDAIRGGPQTSPKAETPDRSVIDRSLQNEVSAKVRGDANVSVDVSKPDKETGVTPKDLFKKDVVERQENMTDSEKGPLVEVD